MKGHKSGENEEKWHYYVENPAAWHIHTFYMFSLSELGLQFSREMLEATEILLQSYVLWQFASN